MIRAVPLLLLAAILAVLPDRVEGCAAVSIEGGRVDVATETALIVWDAATKTQHFIRGGTFRSTGYDFGFLVPTPSRPELDVAADDVFERIAAITAPKIEHRTSYNFPFGCGGGLMMSSKVDVGAAGGVVVVEQKKVGDYDAAVLGFTGHDPATGATELANWLKAHGYSFSPSLAAWLKPYVEQKWLVTAFKIGKAKPEAESKNPAAKKSIASQPIRMSFKTERPFYPYREPEEMRDETAAGLPRSLRVYFVGAKRFAGKIGGTGAWPAKTVWANKLGEADQAALPVKLPVGDVWLTEFEDDSRPRPGTDEVYFEPAADQATVARPPMIITTKDGTPWVLGGLVGLAVGAGLIVRALRRRERPGFSGAGSGSG